MLIEKSFIEYTKDGSNINEFKVFIKRSCYGIKGWIKLLDEVIVFCKEAKAEFVERLDEQE